MLETKIRIISDDLSRFEARESYYPWLWGGPSGLLTIVAIPFLIAWLLLTGSRTIIIDSARNMLTVRRGHFGVGVSRHIPFSDIRHIKLTTATIRKRSGLSPVNKNPASHTVVLMPRGGVRVINVPSYQPSSNSSGHTNFRPDISIILHELTISLTGRTSMRLLTALHDNPAVARAAALLSRKTGVTMETTTD